MKKEEVAVAAPMSPDLQKLADKVVLANATGNEAPFLAAVQELLAAIRSVEVQQPVAWEAKENRRGNVAKWFTDDADAATIYATNGATVRPLVYASPVSNPKAIEEALAELRRAMPSVDGMGDSFLIHQAATRIKALELAAASNPKEPADCVCGEPATAGTVHRTDGPCYIGEAGKTAEEQMQWAIDRVNQPGYDEAALDADLAASKAMAAGIVQELPPRPNLPSHTEPCSLEFVEWALRMERIARAALSAAPPVQQGEREAIDALIDAAFNELQHDTGETNPEYIHQRKVLKAEFKRILARSSIAQQEQPQNLNVHLAKPAESAGTRTEAEKYRRALVSIKRDLDTHETKQGYLEIRQADWFGAIEMIESDKP